IQTSGDFHQANNCNTPIEPQDSCVVKITFTPTAAGVRSGSLTIIHDAAGSPRILELQATGFDQHPIPSLLAVSPPAVTAGSQSITIRVAGQDFFQDSVVRLDGVALPTTYVDDHTLTAPVTAAALAQIGEKAVTVFSPAPGGGVSAPFLVTVYRA